MRRIKIAAAAASIALGLRADAHAASSIQAAEGLAFDASGPSLETLATRSSLFDGSARGGWATAPRFAGGAAPASLLRRSPGLSRSASLSQAAGFRRQRAHRGQSKLGRFLRGARSNLGLGLLAGSVFLGVRMAAAMTLLGALGVMAMMVAGALMLAKYAPLRFDLPPSE